MVTLRRQSFPLLATGLILACVMLGVLAPAPAQADVGVQPILPDGSNIQPDVDTPIQMAAERVVFNVRQATEWDAASVTYNPMAYGLQGTEWNPTLIWQLTVAEVSAVFTMTNRTHQEISMPVWFPLASDLESDEWEYHPGEVAPRIENFVVAVDGQPLEYSVSELPNPKGVDYPLLPWASFPVTFPAGEEVLIQVSYLVWAQEDITGVCMNFSYIFQTGAGWAGTIGRAELIFNLPYLASPETISLMPTGGQIEGYQVRWTWENFEPGPQDDFSIWLIRQERWEELETARLAVQWWPDGESWLKLADTYRRLILGKYQFIEGFGETYQPLGVQAAQEAIQFLPGDGRPHYELAIFYLVALPENPTADDLVPLLEELRLVAELAPTYEGDVRDWMEFILSEELWVSLNENWVTETAVAALMQTTSTTPAQLSPPTATQLSSVTPQPSPIPTGIQPGGVNGNRLPMVIIIAVGVIGMLIVGYMAYRMGRASVAG